MNCNSNKLLLKTFNSELLTAKRIDHYSQLTSAELLSIIRTNHYSKQ